MREATALLEAGFAVSIVDVESERTPLEENIGGICVKHIYMPTWSVPTRFKPWFLVKFAHLLISGTIRLMQTSADIYHAHEENALSACYIAARLRRKPLVFDAHELPLSDGGYTRWPRLRKLSARLLAHMVPNCAGTITVSPPIAQEICRNYHALEVSLIRNVPAYRTTSKSDRLREYLGLNPDMRIALYQGNIQADRGLDRLIHAAAFLEQDTVIVIMGDGPKKMRTQLEALILSTEVSDHVKIIPAVPYAELLEWTASADIGLIVYSQTHSLNVQMCLPNKLFEYLMAGLPVLASPLDVVAHVLGTYDVGKVVSSLIPEDIGAAINAMIADRVALDRMKRSALKTAQEFCWEKESQRLIRLYRHILSK